MQEYVVINLNTGLLCGKPGHKIMTEDEALKLHYRLGCADVPSIIKRYPVLPN